MKPKKTKLPHSCALNVTDVFVHPALQRHFGYCLYKSAMRIRAMMDEELAPHHLIAPQFGILSLLRHSEALSQIELGEQMNIDKATIVKLIDGLEKLKLVNRSADLEDRRIKRIQITKRGLKILDKLSLLRSRVEERFLAPLTVEERAVLRLAIPKLLH